jgi:hypothetical protein
MEKCFDVDVSVGMSYVKGFEIITMLKGLIQKCSIHS